MGNTTTTGAPAVIRPGAEADLPGVYAIHLQGFATEGPEWAWSMGGFERIFRAEGSVLRVAEAGGKIVGYALTTGPLQCGPRKAKRLLTMMEIAEEWRGKGIGTRFVRAAKAAAIADGLALWVPVRITKRHLHAWYRRLGFRYYSTRPSEGLQYRVDGEA
jgi:ribosomal protein S18 acetylase RimI-like enzyme